MSRLPTVGALWIGGSLTWLEQLCLKSFIDQGHHTVLFTYGEVSGVPAGIEIRDGREILDTENFVTHARTESVALFSDLFRFHMIRKCPGMIWVDTDIYCHRPLNFCEEHLHGFEYETSPGNGRANGAVLGLPQNSETLRQMLEFMEDPYPMPEWLGRRQRQEIRERKEAGNPMHVSEMIWGIWGPVGLTAHLKMTGEIVHTKPRDVFYPVHFKDRKVFFKRPSKTWVQVTEDTRTIHLWAPIKRFAAARFDGVCPPDCFLDQLLSRHGIVASAAPVPHMRNRAVVN